MVPVIVGCSCAAATDCCDVVTWLSACICMIKIVCLGSCLLFFFWLGSVKLHFAQSCLADMESSRLCRSFFIASLM